MGWSPIFWTVADDTLTGHVEEADKAVAIGGKDPPKAPFFDTSQSPAVTSCCHLSNEGGNDLSCHQGTAKFGANMLTSLRSRTWMRVIVEGCIHP